MHWSYASFALSHQSDVDYSKLHTNEKKSVAIISIYE